MMFAKEAARVYRAILLTRGAPTSDNQCYVKLDRPARIRWFPRMGVINRQLRRRCPQCRARLPRNVVDCPVCAGRCGDGPELLLAEQRLRAEQLDRERRLPRVPRTLVRLWRGLSGWF